MGHVWELGVDGHVLLLQFTTLSLSYGAITKRGTDSMYPKFVYLFLLLNLFLISILFTSFLIFKIMLIYLIYFHLFRNIFKFLNKF